MAALFLVADTAPGAARVELARAPRLDLPRVVSPAPALVEARLRLPARAQLAIEREIDRAIERGEMPGAMVIAGNRAGVFFRRAFGLHSVEPRRPLGEDAVFDLASVTKAVATATGLAALVEDGRVRYDDLVAKHLPAFAAEDKRRITLRHLLTHTSGLPAVNAVPLSRLEGIATTPLLDEPGARYRYSDLGFIVLGEVVARAAGEPLERFVARRLFEPLGLSDTEFRPAPGPRLVPTAREGADFLTGTVHDPRARALGGVAGHAGLFSSADDLGRLARCLLASGSLDGRRVLREGTVRDMTRALEVPGARVALGWDSPDEPAAAAFSAQSFGHEGFTGTSLWIDPVRDRFVVFLSSRLHPDGKGRVAPTAQAIRTLVAHAEPEPDQPRVELGIDRLAREGFARLRGRRVALLTHAPARDASGRRALDLLASAPGLSLVRVVTPEHGLSASEEGAVPDGRDARTGLPVLSSYGAGASSRAWAGVDTVVVDLVDAGARFYTYVATLLEALESGRRVVVLDRPNPSGGLRVAGPVSRGVPRSLVDPHPLPVMHGMTLGELARFMAHERRLAVGPEVVPLGGWRREMRFEDTGLPWFDPSPNLRSPRAALLYPGVALFEFTNLSVGRGTATPFELVGAPWLDARAVIQSVGPMAGVRLEARDFTPETPPFRGQVCQGIRFSIHDPAELSPLTLAFALARALRAVHPTEWRYEGVGVLLRNDAAERALAAGARPEAVEASFALDLEELAVRRRQWLLY
ncbi:MAG: DUF1343 domain-containing protein [Myxococcales bacterium]|nr:DUF1343 domain-containing protein [Myxococcales bacterium]